jgi:hypothetical protein
LSLLVQLRIALAASVFALAGCAPMAAQNPPGALRPVNAVADGDEAHLMLRGADVVAYFTEGRRVQVCPAHRSVHEGVTFRTNV